MTVLLNFLGAPSTGKTTLSASVFAYLKARDIDVEYSSEYVKTWAWESRNISSLDQYYIFGKEAHQQSRLFNKVDFLISDSPVMLATFYQYFYNGRNTLTVPCHDFYEVAEKEFKVKVINFFLNRQKEYNPKGRYQTKEEADDLSRLLKTWLNFEGFKYHELTCDDSERLEEVVKVLKSEGVF